MMRSKQSLFACRLVAIKKEGKEKNMSEGCIRMHRQKDYFCTENVQLPVRIVIQQG